MMSRTFQYLLSVAVAVFAIAGPSQLAEADNPQARTQESDTAPCEPKCEHVPSQVVISTSAAIESGQPHDKPARSRWLTMRAPAQPDEAIELGKIRPARVSRGFIADFLARSRPVPPPPDIPAERVGNQIADLRLRLRHVERYSPGQVNELRQELAALNEKSVAEELKPAGGGTYRATKETFNAKVDTDGKVHLNDKPDKLDSQDKMMTRMGSDPYARNKLAFLDRTRDQRVAIGMRHREQLGHSLELMQNNVDRLWAITSDLAARKTGLFELCDDCAEAGSDNLAADGTAARARVVGIIRARVRGGEAYTAAELAELNARRSSLAVFAPYE